MVQSNVKRFLKKKLKTYFWFTKGLAVDKNEQPAVFTR
jgi:hypothetical protein